MPKPIFCALFVLLLGSWALGQSPPAVSDVQGRNGRQVLVTLNRYVEAIQTNDSVAMNKIIAADVIVTRHDGSTYGRDEVMNIFNNKSPWRITSAINESVRIRVYGNVALATGALRINEISGQDKRSSVTRYTSVLVKKRGQWQLIALQAALLSEGR